MSFAKYLVQNYNTNKNLNIVGESSFRYTWHSFFPWSIFLQTCFVFPHILTSNFINRVMIFRRGDLNYLRVPLFIHLGWLVHSCTSDRYQVWVHMWASCMPFNQCNDNFLFFFKWQISEKKKMASYRFPMCFILFMNYIIP